MKNILKFAVVLLLLFAMVGTASADVGTVTASAEPHTTNDGNYNVTISWTGSGTGPYTATIQGTSISANTTGVNSAFFEDVTLTPGVFTVTVEDSLAESIPGTLDIPAPITPLEKPVMDNFKSSTTAGTNVYSLTWDWVAYPAGTSLLYNNSNTWTTVTAVPFEVTGDPLSNQIFEFKLNDSTIDSPSTTFEFKKIGFANTTTTDSITWTLDTSGWEDFEYNVTKVDGGDVVVADTTVSSGSPTEIKAENLDPETEYKLTIRGNNSNGKGLWTTNTVKTEDAAVVLIKSIEPTKYYDASKGENQNPINDVENGTTLKLNVTTEKASTFKWTLIYDKGLDGTEDKNSELNNGSNTNDTFYELTWKPSKTGKYILSLEIADKDTPAKKQNVKWEINIPERSTGSRVWEQGMPTDYTWDARSFSGFYYNLDTGQGNESMTIKNIGRTIDDGDLTYTTTTSSTDYDFSSWGSYDIVGFMGDKYFAGDSKSSLMKNGNLSKVLIDTDDKIQLRTGQQYALEEGYSISVQQIDINGGKAQIIFSKDGKEIGSYITNENEDAIYAKNVGSGSGNNTTFVKTRVKSVFQGTESAIVELEGFFQISDKLTRLEEGTTIGKMEITSVSGDRIEMENDGRISLSQDSEVELMGRVKLVVADSGTLRFMPVIEYNDPGVYEIRGTVSDFGNSDYIIMEWNPRNFEGFYYDINDDMKTSEVLTIEQTLTNSSRTIDKGNLTYTSKIQEVSYNYSGWNEKYSVVGFMGEKYYAGDGGSLLKDGNLSKVLVDRDDGYQMRVGSYLTLEEGVSVKVEQIDTNGNKARLVVERNGREIYSDIVSAGNDLVYEGNFSKINDTSFIRVRVDSVFQGTESSIVSISGVFQASLELTKLDSDTKYGKMKMDDYNKEGISLSSDERITLSQDSDVDFMKVGNDTMYFKVGDNSTLRFAPVVERTIGSTDPLTVSLNQSNVTVGDSVKITVTDRGLELEGVTVYVNGSSIGTTNSSGEVNYTANSVGSFKVTGEKSGFVNGSTTLNVAEKLVNMTVRVSPEQLYYGMTGTIKATDSLNGSAVADATVYVSGERVGTTNSSGEFNYTFNNTGNITIDVSKDKYNNGSTTVSISQEVAFVYENFALSPDEPAAKKAVKVTFDVSNNGIKSGSHDLSLVLTDSSGNVIDQDNSTVTVDVGKTKSVTLSVKAPEEGTYKLTLKEVDSNRTINLPSSMSTISVGEATFGSTVLYVVLAIVAIIVIAVIGFVAYLFGVKGATKDNYQSVAQEIFDDVKSKFKR
ncbi:hypothetical protein MmiAt1_06510 [Methanimicrococcus sp. At1]|uniref:Fibronectin type-III domain-containing protein n=1 Tax=Methanimicrococcus hacksteinii TaxID=3028293 RepID=A0ABU3VNV8_9EURY|nr:S-layer protein domain-containing protein [Methanimicrococcus sp. At1]MDV0445094.1 hypothetical protein [Methanimicrococcus sp. At1]